MGQPVSSKTRRGSNSTISLASADGTAGADEHGMEDVNPHPAVEVEQDEAVAIDDEEYVVLEKLGRTVKAANALPTLRKEYRELFTRRARALRNDLEPDDTVRGDLVDIAVGLRSANRPWMLARYQGRWKKAMEESKKLLDEELRHVKRMIGHIMLRQDDKDVVQTMILAKHKNRQDAFNKDEKLKKNLDYDLERLP